MQKTRRMLGFVVLTCLFAAACTATTTDGDSATNTTVADSGGGVGNTVGLTDTTVKISMISADLAQLTEQNLAPEIGNAETTMKAVVADINAHGGVAGRQIELVSHVLKGTDAILNPDLGRQACVQATEDDKPFAVIITASIPAAAGAVRGRGPRRAHHHHGQLAGEPLRAQRRDGSSRWLRTSRWSATVSTGRGPECSTRPGC